jgi:hypothetical protein
MLDKNLLNYAAQKHVHINHHNLIILNRQHGDVLIYTFYVFEDQEQINEAVK